MTELQQKQQAVRDLQIHHMYVKHDVKELKETLAKAIACERSINREGRDALFEFYVNSSHRSFMKFLKESS